METNDQVQPHPASAPATAISKSGRSLRFRLGSALLLAAGLCTGIGALATYGLSGADPVPAKPKETPIGQSWSWDEIFPNWPKDQKPDFVIVLTGQTHGYLQKCGCSDPQKGGLERRWNFIEGFKAHGVETIPLDLGDVSPEISTDHKLLHSQALLKYVTAMKAMKAMGYRYVGVGKEELLMGLHEINANYSLQPGNESPAMLAANIVGYHSQSTKGETVISPKKDQFPNSTGTDTAIRDWGLIPTASKLTLGVVGIVGDPIINDIKKIDPKMAFASNSAKVVFDALNDMNKLKSRPKLNVLLYSGPKELAEKAAKVFPQFGIVVCSSPESEPPAKPLIVKHTGGKNAPDSLLIQVGHKGQNVGVVGVFRNNQGGFDLQYQLVAMSPMFETPKDGKLESKNVALKELERYSKLVQQHGFLGMNRKGPHPLQVTNGKAQYIGSQACAACHDGLTHGDSWKIYAASKHANAYAGLAAATKPSLRQFDGECIRCHTVGYDYNTGFVDAKKTPHLMNVGCESCHGPGSLHAAQSRNKDLALELSPWKEKADDKMPSEKQLKDYLEERNPAKKQAIMTPQQVATMLRVDRTCQQCHNQENDPHFKIEVFWPKVAHSLKPAKPQPEGIPVGNPKDSGPPLIPPTGPELVPPK